MSIFDTVDLFDQVKTELIISPNIFFINFT